MELATGGGDLMLMSGGGGTEQKILCCECGTPIVSNPSNMCIGCIRSKVDITEGIQKQALIPFCKACERYFQPPNMWVNCELESRELLTVCLKKLKGLSKTHLVDAGFVWTEPHSKRLKVKLTIQAEVLNSTILQQTFVVDFIVQYQMCDDCHRREAKDFWKCVVQVRQKCSHKKTFYHLEQLILKTNLHSDCVNIKQVHEGLDFYYANKQHGRKMVDFLSTVVPCRTKTSQRLISSDIHNNTYNYKDTFSVELAPVSKGDLVCLPTKVAKSLSNIGQIVVCSKVTSSLHFVDPTTGKCAEMNSAAYWRNPFSSFCTAKQFCDFTVLDTEKNRDTISSRFCQADVYLMRNSETAGSDAHFHARSHLGHIISAGDTVRGFDFSSANLNDANLELMNKDRIPDVVLLKKIYDNPELRRKRRNWKLKELPIEKSNDYDEFLDDLEEDKDLRSGVNIYKDPSKVAVGAGDAADYPTVGLEEMLEDLHMDDAEMLSDDDEE